MLIVTYHAVCERPSPVCATPAQLEADLSALSDAGFAFVSLDDCADWLGGLRSMPRRAAAVTFDDGYASVASRGVSILKRFSVPATVFVIADRVGGSNQWAGQWKSIPSMPLADAGQLRELAAAGVSIGSHTASHPALTEVDAEKLREEVEESADRIEQLLDTPVRHFAYPYGFAGPREIAAVRRRYRTAVNAESRLVPDGADPHDLNRVDCHDLRVAIHLRVYDSPLLDSYLAVRRGFRGLRRRADRLLGHI